MSRAEFIVAAKTYYKRTEILVFSPFLLIMVVAAVYAPYHNTIQDYFDSKFSWAVSAFLSIAPIAFPAFAAFLVMVPFLRRVQKNPLICCPHCRKNVADIRGVVIATNNCPFCGLQVLDEKP